MPRPKSPADEMQIQFRLPKPLHAKLHKLAAQERRTLAALTRIFVEEGLQRRGAIPPLKTSLNAIYGKNAARGATP
jgi:hypothetical protein